MPGTTEGAQVETVLVDGHVHLHDPFGVAAWLDAAWRNFAGAASRLDLAGRFVPVLMLTESAGVDRFSELASRVDGASDGGWSLRRTDEPTSLIAESGPDRSVVLVAGRQIVAREGVEVLALNFRGGPSDGAPFDATLDAVLAGGAAAVAPWGFGKWWFSRGALIDRTVRRRPGRRFFLGDNAGRPAGSASPALFRTAAELGTWTLPGSDPLPFRSERGKVGRYGFRLEGPLDRRRPGAWIVERLEALDRQPESFGRLERLGDFIRLQLAMQWRKRIRRTPA